MLAFLCSTTELLPRGGRGENRTHDRKGVCMTWFQKPVVGKDDQPVVECNWPATTFKVRARPSRSHGHMSGFYQCDDFSEGEDFPSHFTIPGVALSPRRCSLTAFTVVSGNPLTGLNLNSWVNYLNTSEVVKVQGGLRAGENVFWKEYAAAYGPAIFAELPGGRDVYSLVPQ